MPGKNYSYYFDGKRLLIGTVTMDEKYLIVTVTMNKKYLIVTLASQ